MTSKSHQAAQGNPPLVAGSGSHEHGGASLADVVFG